MPRYNRVRGTICLSTGTGKSKVAIDFINHEKKVVNILITSPRTNLKENWRKELLKWGFEQWSEIVWSNGDRSFNITVENIQTVYKWRNRRFDLIIADEIHTMMTPEYSDAFKHLAYTYLMGLTATHDITKDNDKKYYYDKYAPIVFEYYDSAEDGLINKTQYFIVDHHLTNDDKIIVKTKDKKFPKGELDHYEYLTDRIKKGQQLMMQQGSTDWFNDARRWFWERRGTKEEKFAAMMYLNSIRYRKEFLQNLPSTALIARRIRDGILKANENNKVLIFSELTKQAECISVNTVHSGNNDEANATRIEQFNSGLIRELGSCHSLTLGLNLKGATHAIMESYVGSATKSKQKKGRLDRLEADKMAELWIIRVVDTQAEKWYDNMTKGMITEDSVVTYITSKDIRDGKFDFKIHQLRE